MVVKVKYLHVENGRVTFSRYFIKSCVAYYSNISTILKSLSFCLASSSEIIERVTHRVQISVHTSWNPFTVFIGKLFTLINGSFSL